MYAPPKNVVGQGWPETSAHGCARSGFWEGRTPAGKHLNQQGYKPEGSVFFVFVNCFAPGFAATRKYQVQDDGSNRT